MFRLKTLQTKAVQVLCFIDRGRTSDNQSNNNHELMAKHALSIQQEAEGSPLLVHADPRTGPVVVNTSDEPKSVLL